MSVLLVVSSDGSGPVAVLGGKFPGGGVENEAGKSTGEKLGNGVRPGKMVVPGNAAAAGRDEGPDTAVEPDEEVPGKDEEPDKVLVPGKVDGPEGAREPDRLDISGVPPTGGSLGMMGVATPDEGEESRSDLESINT